MGGEITLQKVINNNEARGIGRMSPDPLLLGGVWGRDYLSPCTSSLWLLNANTRGNIKDWRMRRTWNMA